ncbi:hypothetical protein WJX77_010160 [Trebouxia sp. C0004]
MSKGIANTPTGAQQRTANCRKFVSSIETRSLAEWEPTGKIVLQTCKHISLALIGLLLPYAVTVALQATQVVALISITVLHLTMQLTKAVARRRMQCIRVTPYQMRKWGMLLAIAFVMNGWSFCSVESPEFKDFMAHVRPNFELPSAYMLRGVLLDGALAIVKLQQAAWMGDDSIAFHATVTLDGWSNSPMIIEELERWGPHRFAAIVTDNAQNMQRTRRLVLQRFPHLVEVRCMMHAFSTTMASVMGHSYAEKLISRAQRLPASVINHHCHDHHQDAPPDSQGQSCQATQRSGGDHDK